MRLPIVLLLLLGLCLPARAQDSLIILDASNSMLSRVDGRSRLDAARLAVEGLARAVPGRARMGLMAFGHRRPADCEDIELLIAPGPVSAPVFARLGNLLPRGRTPIAGAVQDGARIAPQLILITDGGENCVPDPCAEIRALRLRHPGLALHVIGFDVADGRDEAQLRCVAEAGGGRYLPAASLFELAFALAELAGSGPIPLAPTGAPVTPAPPGTNTRLVLEAHEMPGGTPVPVESWTVLVPGNPPRAVLTDSARLQPELSLPPGRYEIRVNAGLARIVERVEVEGARMTHGVVLNLGTLRPLGALAAARPGRAGLWTVLADEVPGYRLGDQVTAVEAAEPVFRLTQGSYRLRFQAGEAAAEVPVLVEAGRLVTARVNLGAADITIIPTRGGRPIPSQMAEVRRPGDPRLVASSPAIRPRFVLPAGEWVARVRVENTWRELPMTLTIGQEAEIPLPLP